MALNILYKCLGIIGIYKNPSQMEENLNPINQASSLKHTINSENTSVTPAQPRRLVSLPRNVPMNGCTIEMMSRRKTKLTEIDLFEDYNEFEESVNQKQNEDWEIESCYRKVKISVHKNNSMNSRSEEANVKKILDMHTCMFKNLLTSDYFIMLKTGKVSNYNNENDLICMFSSTKLFFNDFVNNNDTEFRKFSIIKYIDQIRRDTEEESRF